MTTLKSERREAKQRRQKHGMRVSGRSVKTLLAGQANGSIGLAAKRKAAVKNGRCRKRG